MALKEES